MDDSRERWNRQRPQQIVEDDEINLLSYLRLVSKHKWMIILICTVSVLLAGIYSLTRPKMYSATAAVVPPIDTLEQKPELDSGMGLGKGSLLRNALGVTSVADMYAGILQSRTVLDAIVERFDLMDAYEVEQYRSKAREKLSGSTAVEVSEEGIVFVTVQDRDPNRAAAMANAFVQELDKQNKRLSSGQATSKRVFLESRVKEIEQELSDIENIPAKQAQIKEMLYELLCRQCELARIEEAKSIPTIQVLDEAVVPERRLPRGTKRKVIIAGALSLMFGLFVAFAREYVVKARQREAEQRQAALSGHKRPGEEEGDSNVREDQNKGLQEEDTIYTRPT